MTRVFGIFGLHNRQIGRHLLATVMGLIFGLSVAGAQESEDTIRSLKAQADRARVIYERGLAPHYTQEFDLSGLPRYVPKKQLNGWLRIHGSNYLSDGALGEYWRQAFAKFQPGIRISYYLPTSAVAFAALYYDQADLAIGRGPGFYDLLAYQRVKNASPIEITAVAGSYDVPGWENSTVILVNEDNPIKGLTMDQLDGIFGAARDGGWAGTNFRPDRARGPEGNIRTWGEVGLTVEWADRPINVYGFNLRYNTATDFSDKVLGEATSGMKIFVPLRTSSATTARDISKQTRLPTRLPTTGTALRSIAIGVSAQM